MTARPNFYLLLNLTDLSTDQKVIKDAIAEKERAWRQLKNTGVGKQRLEAERNLKLLPEIKQVMSDPGRQRSEAKAAKKELKAQREQQQQDFERTIKVLDARGYVLQKDLDQITNRYASLLELEEIKRRLQSAGIPVHEKLEQGPPPATGSLDEQTGARIRDNLEHTGYKDLYEFLGATSRRQSVSVYRELAKKKEREVSLKKAGGEKTAQERLLSASKKIFESETEREKYDEYESVSILKPLKYQVKIASNSGFIPFGTYQMLLHIAIREFGTTEAIARSFLKTCIHELNVLAEEESPGSGRGGHRCSSCGVWNIASAVTCVECSQPMTAPCPRCMHVVPCDLEVCPKCRATIADAPYVHGLIQEAQDQIRFGSLAEAQILYDKILLLWPDWETAVDGRRKNAEKIAARERDLVEIETLLKKRELFAAQSAINKAIRLYGKHGLEKQQEHVSRDLKSAEKEFHQGQSLERRDRKDEALSAYEAALNLCADYELARKALVRIGVPPANDIVARVFANKVQLNWKPPRGSHGYSYVVVRCTGQAPKNINDGERIAETEDCRYEDSKPQTGAILYYAIYTKRAEQTSLHSVVTEPLLIADDVTGLKVSAGNASNRLTWQAPPACSRVEVWWRIAQPPKAQGDGNYLAAERSGVSHRSLENGKPYGYRVIAVFDDPKGNGKPLFSRGVTLTSTPQVPPKPIMDLKPVVVGDHVELRWGSTKDKVQIRCQTTNPSIKAGQQLGISELNRYGIAIAPKGPGRADHKPKVQGRLYFVPFVTRGSVTLAGQMRSVTFIQPLNKIEAKSSGKKLSLTWQWPSGADSAVFCISPDAFPSLPTDGAKRIPISFEEYQRTKELTFDIPDYHRIYISAFNTVGDKEKDFSKPKRVLYIKQNMTVKYEVKYKKKAKFVRSEVVSGTLQLSTQGPVTLRDLVFVRNPVRVPKSIKDGITVFQVDEVILTNKRFQIEIPEAHLNVESYGRLFFRSREEGRGFTLQGAKDDHVFLQ